METISRLMAAIDACASQLERLNNQFPHLATTSTLQGVESWRGRRVVKPTPVEEPPQKSASEPLDIRALAIGLVADHSLEDALDMLLEQHDIDLSMRELVHLIGRKSYSATLKRDLRELLKNAISYEQIANLWNDLERPALGNDTWNSRSISLLDN
ncbi:MAG: hypothetical protein KDI68_13095 [Gammaproteobacteria bacterium]|nr:hypothetical protein [Gammaproteobacteria bacterium]